MPATTQSTVTKKTQQRRERRAPFAASAPRPRKRTIGRSTTRETPLHVRTRGVELDEALRDYIVRRVGFKLGKYALNITRVSVRFEHVRALKSAPAVECKFKVVVPGMRPVVLAASSQTARTAFDAAVETTEHAMRTTLGRSRAKRNQA